MVFIKKFKKNANKLLIIQNCLPFKESVALYLNKLESCSPNIHAKCGWYSFGFGSFGEEDENVKSLQRRRTNFDKEGSLKPLAQVS